MLERVSVKGFRSLKDFTLDIRPGLNVLVGPNGAGKTNIILFFEFLRSMMFESVSDAVGAAGGVAEVFSKRGRDRFSDSMSAQISGRVEVSGTDYRYMYTCSIAFSAGNQEVSFSSQQLQIHKIDKNGKESRRLDAKFSADDDGPGAISLERSSEFSTASSWVWDPLESTCRHASLSIL